MVESETEIKLFQMKSRQQTTDNRQQINLIGFRRWYASVQGVISIKILNKSISRSVVHQTLLYPQLFVYKSRLFQIDH